MSALWGTPPRVKELTNGRGADVVVEGVGGAAVVAVLPESIGCLKLGGRLVVLGYNYGIPLAVDTADLIYRQWSILGRRLKPARRGGCGKAGGTRPAEAGSLRTIPLEQVEAALARLRKSPPLGRIVLESGD